MHLLKEKMIYCFFAITGLSAIFIVAAILILLFSRSMPFFSEIGFSPFFTDAQWNPTSYTQNTYGIRTMVVGTFMVTIGAMLFAIPISIGAASYLAYLSSSSIREVFKPMVEILAGIPSVVIGFFGLVVLNPMIARIFQLSNGLNALNGAILLGIMAMPTIISLSEDAIYSVPFEYKEASLALGADRWQTLVRVVIPSAKSGLIAACMLGTGRAIGETMTVLMVTGNVRAMPKSMTDSISTLTATIAIEMGEVAFHTTHYYALFAIGFVLFIMTFFINLASDMILHKNRS